MEYQTPQDALVRVVRAAEYVRMSTEHQKYSTANQSAAIRDYASTHDIEIVRSYCDSGRSGLTLDGRPGLKQLLTDVQTGSVDYDVVLVFDVSRWGRFQDVDESAHYEFICRRSGVAIHYCAEQFQNDGSPLSAVVKGLKRAMAGEYSRELSLKTFAGQARIVRLGYHMGGRPGYGLRRQLLDERGVAKAVLETGQRKNIQSDRTILVPGPSDEVRVVRWIFEMFATGTLHEGQIAHALNERGLLTSKGAAWSFAYVHRILVDEKYIGVSVWNANSYKLKSRRATNGVEERIRVERAWQPIVDQTTFDTVQQIVRARERERTRPGMVERLRQLHRDHGVVTVPLIFERLGTAAAWRYQTKFGSFTLAFEAAGVPQAKDRRYVRTNRVLRNVRARVVTAIISGVERCGGCARVDGQHLRINDQFNIAVFPMRCVTGPNGELRWIRYIRAVRGADVFVAVRVNPDNRSIRDFCIIPSVEVPANHLRLSQCRDRLLRCYRFDDLQVLFRLAENSALEHPA